MFRIVWVILMFQLLADVFALKGGLLSVLTHRDPHTGGKRIINGIEVKANEIKYQVFIHGRLRRDDYRWKYECGGCIIAERYILTAAHCVTQPNHTFPEVPPVIVPGIIDAYATSGNAHFEVERAYVPRGFEWLEHEDIAVLKLKGKLHLGRRSSLAKIDLPAAKTTNTYAGMQALVTGFGVDGGEYEYDNGDGDNQTDSSWTWTASGKLRKIHVRVITDEEVHSLSDYCEPRDDVICALVNSRYEYGGICHGDSGSPLVVGNTVIGVVSGSNNEICNNLEDPGQYTRVSNYVGFIENAMNDAVTPDMRVHFW